MDNPTTSTTHGGAPDDETTVDWDALLDEILTEHNLSRYIVTRDVTPGECDWLDTTVYAGDVVYRYDGPTYGCVSFGTAVSLTGDTPFFELPNDALTVQARAAS